MTDYYKRVVCIDFIGQLSEQNLKSGLSKVVSGIAVVKTYGGLCHTANCEKWCKGWGAIHFESEEYAQQARMKLSDLYIYRESCGLDLPFLVHPVEIEDTMCNHTAGHIYVSSGVHFMQPNSLEFDLAIRWRCLDYQKRYCKQELMKTHIDRYESILQDYKEIKKWKNSSMCQQSTDVSRYIILRDCKCSSATGIESCFKQWLDRPKAHLIQDIIAPEDDMFLCNGFVKTRLKTPEHAKMVCKDIEEMMITLNGPRPLKAHLIQPGMMQGYLSTLETALQNILGFSTCSHENDLVRFTSIDDEDQTINKLISKQLKETMLNNRYEREELRSEFKRQELDLESTQKERLRIEICKYERMGKLLATDVMKTHCKKLKKKTKAVRKLDLTYIEKN